MSEAIQRTARLEVGVGHTGLIVHERPAVNCHHFVVLQHCVYAPNKLRALTAALVRLLRDMMLELFSPK